MALITLQNAQLAYGDAALLDRAGFSLLAGERVGLVGRNGTGKSSLLKILAGLEALDDGQVQRVQGLRTTYLPQEPVAPDDESVADVVKRGLNDDTPSDAEPAAGSAAASQPVQHHSRLDDADGWRWAQRVDEMLTRLQLDPSALMGTLSGGTRKRVFLAQSLVGQPDVLLLDEPTNHLDMQAIAWLEELILQFRGSVIVISHDRTFLDRVTTRVVELDRGVLRSYAGNFSNYVREKEAQLEQEVVVNAKADKLLAQEEVWVRKGVEARRTRSQSRIGRLEQLRQARAQRREALGRVRMDVATGTRSGKIVVELQNVSHAFDGRVVINDLSTTVLRGDKIGLLGPNGAGKTTLIRVLLGLLKPDTGKVKLGTQLEVAHFDQMRTALRPEMTLEDFISPGSEWIEIGAQRKHVKSYLSDFLFSPARAHAPISALSGGERNRLLLARLFARPANLLVLDEPTNDLDIDTLELLEELLQTYSGTVLLVSHDRTFLNNVVTSTLAFEGNGLWREYEGDVQDWLQQSQRAMGLPSAASKPRAGNSKNDATQRTPTAPASKASTPPQTARKLSHKEQRELTELPERITALETEQAAITHLLQSDGGAIYKHEPQRANELAARHAAIDEGLLEALERWDTLERAAKASVR